jgi:pentatricopeptide repeat protein
MMKKYYQMKISGIKPSYECYKVLCRAYGKDGDLKAMYNQYEEMMKEKITPKVSIYNIMMKYLLEYSDFHGLVIVYEEMLKQRIQPNMKTLDILMEAMAFDNKDYQKLLGILERCKRDEISLIHVITSERNRKR